MEKEDYIVPDIRIKKISEELLSSLSQDTKNPPEEDDGGDFGAKSSIWNKFDNEE